MLDRRTEFSGEGVVHQLYIIGVHGQVWPAVERIDKARVGKTKPLEHASCGDCVRTDLADLGPCLRRKEGEMDVTLGEQIGHERP